MVWPASIASAVDPSTMRDSSGPSPPTAVLASSTTVRRLSCGIACSALLVASSRLPISGGTWTLSTGITSPARSVAASESSVCGINWTNCSPTAERLCTSAADVGRNLGRRVQLEHSPHTVVGDVDRGDPADLGPAVGHHGRRVQPTGRGQLECHVVAADAEQRRHVHEAESHDAAGDYRDRRQDRQLNPHRAGQAHHVSRPPIGTGRSAGFPPCTDWASGR